MNVEDKKTFIAENYPDCMVANGFGDAILGIVERYGHEAVVLYDKNKCIEILMERDKMSEEDAYEHFYYNVIGSYVGKYTPCFAEILQYK